MVEQELILAMIESDAPIMFGQFVGGWALAKSAAPYVLGGIQSILGYGGIRSGSSQAELDRAARKEEFDKMFKLEEERYYQELEDYYEARDYERAFSEEVRAWDRSRDFGRYKTNVSLGTPSWQWSRAIGARTMQQPTVPRIETTFRADPPGLA
jgi:hypothetical protein